jgi:transposase
MGDDGFGCNIHGRRKFEQAAVNGAKAGKTIAGRVMGFYKMINDFEEELANVPPVEKAKNRNEKQKSLFEGIRSIVRENQNKVPEKSQLGQPFTNLENEHDCLTRYLDDGHLGPDNGMFE